MSMEEEQNFPVGDTWANALWGNLFLKIRTLAADWEPPDDSSNESSDRISLYHIGRRKHLFPRLTGR